MLQRSRHEAVAARLQVEELHLEQAALTAALDEARGAQLRVAELESAGGQRATGGGRCRAAAASTSPCPPPPSPPPRSRRVGVPGAVPRCGRRHGGQAQCGGRAASMFRPRAADGAPHTLLQVRGRGRHRGWAGPRLGFRAPGFPGAGSRGEAQLPRSLPHPSPHRHSSPAWMANADGVHAAAVRRRSGAPARAARGRAGGGAQDGRRGAHRRAQRSRTGSGVARCCRWRRWQRQRTGGQQRWG